MYTIKCKTFPFLGKFNFYPFVFNLLLDLALGNSWPDFILFILFYFKTGSHCVVLADLELAHHVDKAGLEPIEIFLPLECWIGRYVPPHST